MEKGEPRSRNKPDRKTIEKNRRIMMKGLFSKLVSLVPNHHFNPPREYLSQQDQIDQTGAYIKILKERIEDLKRRKTQADSTNLAESSKLPILEIKELGAYLEVGLISGVNKNFLLHQIICIIEEEGSGAEVVTVSISTIGDKIFHTIHAQAKVARVGMDTSRISERIHELISQGFVPP